MSALAPTLETFFTDRLVRRRQSSPETVAAYRDSLRLLVGFASQLVHKAASHLDIAHLDATVIASLLDHLARDRQNSVRMRNARLAAVHSLSAIAPCATSNMPRSVSVSWRSRQKRSDRTLIDLFILNEVEALLAASDRSTWTRRRTTCFCSWPSRPDCAPRSSSALTCRDLPSWAGPHVAAAFVESL